MSQKDNLWGFTVEDITKATIKLKRTYIAISIIDVIVMFSLCLYIMFSLRNQGELQGFSIIGIYVFAVLVCNMCVGAFIPKQKYSAIKFYKKYKNCAVEYRDVLITTGVMLECLEDRSIGGRTLPEIGFVSFEDFQKCIYGYSNHYRWGKFDNASKAYNWVVSRAKYAATDKPNIRVSYVADKNSDKRLLVAVELIEE